jgi:hypothetical protein
LIPIPQSAIREWKSAEYFYLLRFDVPFSFPSGTEIPQVMPGSGSHWAWWPETAGTPGAFLSEHVSVVNQADRAGGPLPAGRGRSPPRLGVG